MLLPEIETNNDDSAESQPYDAFAEGAPNPTIAVGTNRTIDKHLTSRLKFLPRLFTSTAQEYLKKLKPVKARTFPAPMKS